MKMKHRWAAVIGALVGMAAGGAGPAQAVEDGLGTNHIGVLRASGLELGGETRSAWPTETDGVGGTFDFRVQSNRVVWAPAFRWTGELGTLRAQTDGGEVDARIVRSKWNDGWDAHTVIGEVHATAAGVETAGWSSAWVSNGYRIGVIVTNHTTGTSLWWSVDCARTGQP